MSRRMRNWMVGALLATGLIFGARLLFRPQPIVVETHTVTAGTVEDVVANSEGCTVRSRAQARLGAERAGRVEAILHREGEAVRRGDVLLRLDISSAARRLEAARRELEAMDGAHQAAHAADDLARRSLGRVEPLGWQALASPGEVDEARARADAARAELAAAEARRSGAVAAVRIADDDLAHHVVQAPFDGVVTRRLVEIGEPVVPGQPVLELVSLDRLYVSAPVDERDVGRLTRAGAARVTLDSYPGREWRATVTRIAPILETAREQNRTLEIELDLAPDRSLPVARPGMTADVEVVIDRRDGVLRVPTAAVGEGGRVLVAVRGRAVSRRIDSGLHNWEWT